MQKPHWRPWHSQNACCRGWSSSGPGPSPSTVVSSCAVGLDGEQDARAHRLAVEQHGAGAAHPVLAADVGAGEAEVVAQEVREQQARLDLALVGAAVDA